MLLHQQKVIAGFAKEHEALEVKTGVMEGNVISAEEVKTVGSLPSRWSCIYAFICITSTCTQLRMQLKLLENKKESAE